MLALIQTNKREIVSRIVGTHITGDIEKFASTADFSFPIFHFICQFSFSLTNIVIDTDNSGKVQPSTSYPFSNIAHILTQKVSICIPTASSAM